MPKEPQAMQEALMKHIQEFQNELTTRIDTNNAALERDYQLRKKIAAELGRQSFKDLARVCADVQFDGAGKDRNR